MRVERFIVSGDSRRKRYHGHQVENGLLKILVSGEQVEADQGDEVGPAYNEGVVPHIHVIIVGQEVYRTKVKDWNDVLE